VETCLSEPCKNAGICVSNEDDSFGGCFCRHGFKGKYCEIVVPTTYDCSTLHCLNGGSCKTENSTAYCSCKIGFNGTRCENEYFKCTRNGRFSDPMNCSSGKYIECAFYGQSKYILN
jgi:hypothetical protein